MIIEASSNFCLTFVAPLRTCDQDRGKIIGMPTAVALYEHALAGSNEAFEPLPPALERGSAKACSPCLDELARKLRHSRGRGVRARRKWKDMRCDDVAVIEQAKTIECHFLGFCRKSRDEVGADRRIAAKPFDTLDGPD
jgi:hypothetical protein